MYTNDSKLDKLAKFLNEHKIILYIIPILFAILGSFIIIGLNKLLVYICFGNV